MSKSGFEATHRPVPEHRKDAAYRWLRLLGIEPEGAFFTSESMAELLERDKPHDAMETARKVVDLIGAYRLMALLLTGDSNE